MISEAQRKKFYPLQHRAWLTHSARICADPSDRKLEDSWYRGEMQQLLGVKSTKDLNPIDGFDLIMFHWAEIIGDDREIQYWSNAAERRMKHLIECSMDKLSYLEDGPVSWDYVRAIGAHMNIPKSINECPVELLWKLFQALDTHVRRLQKKSNSKAKVPQDTEPVPF